jgi:flagellar basal-body rod protein FlgF
MADGLYVGMAGAVARSRQLEAISDNLANVQTPGFKAERPAFEAFLAAPGSDKVSPAAVQTSVDLRPGPTNLTGRPLDVLPGGNGFFAVEQPSGTRAYTRDGRIQVDANGTLRVGQNAILDNSGSPITIPPGSNPTIDDHGRVLVEGNAVAQLGIYELQGTVDRLGTSLVAPAPNGDAVPVQAGVTTGVVEMGNAGGMEAAVALVSAQRHYETSMQAIQTYRRLDEKAAEVGKVR